MSTLQKTDLSRITKITNDITKLDEFCDSLKSQRNKKIKALYIITEDNYQIELKGNFSETASQKLLDLIIESRSHLIDGLHKVLKDCFELVQLDESLLSKQKIFLPEN